MKIASYKVRAALNVERVTRRLEQGLLGSGAQAAWKVELCRELHMTGDRRLFESSPGPGRVRLCEGRTIHQYDHQFAKARYWVDEERGVERLRSARLRRLKAAAQQAGAKPDTKAIEPTLDYEHYRFGFRDIARSSDERSMLCAILPRKVFAGNTLNLLRPMRDEFHGGRWREVATLKPLEMLYVVAVFNSFVADWLLRQRISAHLTMFQVYQLPLPRLTEADPRLLPIANRAAKLTCTSPEFDDLAKSVGLGSHRKGVTDPEARAQLRAEIDGLVAHLYGLTEEEFAHVLGTFPVVPEPVREAARNAYRAVARGDVK